MQPLTICTFKWGDKYTDEHVRRLHSMLARNLTIPWRFLLITDRPSEQWDVLPLWEDMRNTNLCGVRIRAFGKDMAERIGPRFAWIDLDVVITGNVDHIFGRTEDFVGLQTAGPPLPYNGSLVMMDAGARSQVYERWTPEEYASIRAYWGAQGIKSGAQSDEGWIGYVLGNDEARITRDDGVYYFRRQLGAGKIPLPADARLVILNGRAFDPAKEALQEQCPWIKEHWR